MQRTCWESGNICWWWVRACSTVSSGHLNVEIVASAVRKSNDSVLPLSGIADCDVGATIVVARPPVLDCKVTWNVASIAHALEPAYRHSVASLPYDCWATWSWRCTCNEEVHLQLDSSLDMHNLRWISLFFMHGKPWDETPIILPGSS